MTEQPDRDDDAPAGVEVGESVDTPDSDDHGPEPVPHTGVAAADAAAERLAELEHAALDEHVEIYEDVHRRLQEGLADLDDQ